MEHFLEKIALLNTEDNVFYLLLLYQYTNFLTEGKIMEGDNFQNNGGKDQCMYM